VTKPIVPQKTCPSCAANLPLATQQCECGHLFDVDETQDVRPHGELLAKAEALYESYLRTHVMRARRSLQDAKLELNHDPRNREKMTQAKRSERELWVLETELAIQIAKTTDARKRIKQARTELAQTSRSKIDSVPETIASENNNESPALLSSDPTGNFRSAQVLIAEAALKTVQANMAAREHRQDNDGSSFRANQTAKAEEAVVKARSEQVRECPACSTVLSSDSTQCHCGYVFPDNDKTTRPFLSRDEIEALRFLNTESSRRNTDK
jgi:hypothetical protein